MNEQTGRSAKKLDLLKREMGLEFELPGKGEGNPNIRYHLLSELDLGGQHYAVLRAAEDPDEDAYLFRVTGNEGERKIMHIEDEAEWEQVADAIDEMLYFDEY